MYKCPQCQNKITFISSYNWWLSCKKCKVKLDIKYKDLKGVYNYIFLIFVFNVVESILWTSFIRIYPDNTWLFLTVRGLRLAFVYIVTSWLFWSLNWMKIELREKKQK